MSEKKKVEKPVTKKVTVNDGSRTKVMKDGKDITPPAPKKTSAKPEGGK